MLDSLGTLLARFIVRLFTRPRVLVTSAWRWLAAEADDTEEKRRCLKAVLDLDPGNEPASSAFLLLDERRPRGWEMPDSPLHTPVGPAIMTWLPRRGCLRVGTHLMTLSGDSRGKEKAYDHHATQIPG
jgi:hypothetical protein